MKALLSILFAAVITCASFTSCGTNTNRCTNDSDSVDTVLVVDSVAMDSDSVAADTFVVDSIVK